jgi:hypothetical protein
MHDFRSAHWVGYVNGVDYERIIAPYRDDRAKITETLLPLIEKLQGFADVPFPALYAELNAIYPASKFILTTRDLDNWWQSVVRHWNLERRRIRALMPFEYVQYNRYAEETLNYITIKDEDLAKKLHATHVETVTEYFANQPGRLLCVSLNDPKIGDKISSFLGTQSGVPYPYIGAIGSYGVLINVRETSRLSMPVKQFY